MVIDRDLTCNFPCYIISHASATMTNSFSTIQATELFIVVIAFIEIQKQ